MVNKEIVVIEEVAKAGKKPAANDVIYRFRVGKIHADTDKRSLTGTEILTLVGLSTQNRLYQKVSGGQRIPIDLDEEVDLAKPGLERFETIPLDPTEG
ncbi:multiubiquitin domain-containing protein [Cytobacillus suaedae]|nr:multiubiquitin domain-containing protein [Cytobacillus suaedae]